MADQRGSGGIVQKKQARSGLVDYANQVVLHDTRDTRIVLVPMFVPHRTGASALILKLVRQPKRSLERETEINLGEEASRLLLRELPRLAELAGQPTGNYLVVPVQGSFQIGSLAPDVVARALLGVLADKNIAQRFAQGDFASELAEALRANIRLRDIRTAVEELRRNLDDGINDESAYQDWCRRHGWAFGTTYREADEIRDIAVGDTVDFLLPTLVGYRDIIELKRPDMEVLSYDASHRNYFWTREASMAVGQCSRYLEQLQGIHLRDAPDIAAHHPRATVIIGRSNNWTKEKMDSLVSLNSALNGINVMTYDLLLKQAERLLEIVSDESAPTPGARTDWHDEDVF